jgi:hypothetical protein
VPPSGVAVIPQNSGALNLTSDANRPVLTPASAGFMYLDAFWQTLILWDGSFWRDRFFRAGSGVR